MKKLIINNFPNYRATSAKYFATGLALVFSATLFAQDGKPVETNSLSVFSNPLFNTLLGVIILLLIIISVLGGVLKNVAQFSRNKNKENNSGKFLSIVAFIFLVAKGNQVFAQTAETATNVAQNGYMGLSNDLFVILISAIILEIIIIWVLISSIQLFLKSEVVKTATAAAVKEEPSLLEKLNASVAIENEETIMLDHNYDGIRELDNDLPPWWKYGFYLTIVFAFVYLINFHVSKTGDLQKAEYDKSIIAANIAKEEFQKNSANNVNESNVKLITDKAQLDEGANVFKENCFVCHGKMGEGGVGPNLTDDYWIHGGSISDIFKTIKYGWPDKGMKSWQADLTPVKISELASYIKTLRGTNPANAKAPQGDLFIENNSVAVADSTKKDSTQIVSAVIDSVKVEKK